MDFKVRCIETTDDSWFTAGKIYEVVNGKLIDNDGDGRPTACGSVRSINDFWKSWGKFELVEEEKMFTKDDLKVGYLVCTRETKLYMVMPYKSGTCFVNKGGWLAPAEYGEDLLMKDRDDREYDIVEVYGLNTYAPHSLNISVTDRPLLWERKEITELSLQQIADKFNIPVETLRVKE